MTPKETRTVVPFQGRRSEDPSPRLEEAYQELRRIARKFRRHFPHQTLQTTDLVHEAFIRLVETGPKQYLSQPFFFACVGRAMYATLVDRARRRRAWKRGRGVIKVPLNQVNAANIPMPRFDDLREALEDLGAFNPRLRQVLELRFMFGFSVEEVANAVGRKNSTVRRDCALAKAWLQRELTRTA